MSGINLKARQEAGRNQIGELTKVKNDILENIDEIEKTISFINDNAEKLNLKSGGRTAKGFSDILTHIYNRLMRHPEAGVFLGGLSGDNREGFLDLEMAVRDFFKYGVEGKFIYDPKYTKRSVTHDAKPLKQMHHVVKMSAASPDLLKFDVFRLRMIKYFLIELKEFCETKVDELDLTIGQITESIQKNDTVFSSTIRGSNIHFGSAGAAGAAGAGKRLLGGPESSVNNIIREAQSQAAAAAKPPTEKVSASAASAARQAVSAIHLEGVDEKRAALKAAAYAKKAANDEHAAAGAGAAAAGAAAPASETIGDLAERRRLEENANRLAQLQIASTMKPGTGKLAQLREAKQAADERVDNFIKGLIYNYNMYLSSVNTMSPTDRLELFIKNTELESDVAMHLINVLNTLSVRTDYQQLFRDTLKLAHTGLSGNLVLALETAMEAIDEKVREDKELGGGDEELGGGGRSRSRKSKKHTRKHKKHHKRTKSTKRTRHTKRN